MRAWARLLVVSTVLALSAGPVLAASVTLAPGPTLHAPAAPGGPVTRGLVWLLGAGVAVGLIKVKDAAAVAAKYKTRAGAAAKDYTDGVAGAGQDWETGARNGEGNYEQGVQEAIGKKRYGRGIAAAGSAKYVDNAVKLGALRYPQGVQNAEGAYQKGVAPVLDKLRSLNLPPKGPRRSPQNQARANMVALELGKMKDGQ